MPRPKPRCGNCSEITVTDHLEWAAAIGSKVARHHHLHGQERDDLISTAQLTLCELAARSPARGGFDPSRVPLGGDPIGAFRGWAYRFLTCECGREAARLRNGGTFHTVRPENLFAVPTLGDAAGDVSADEAAENTTPERETVEPDVLSSVAPADRPFSGLGCPADRQLIVVITAFGARPRLVKGGCV